MAPPPAFIAGHEPLKYVIIIGAQEIKNHAECATPKEVGLHFAEFLRNPCSLLKFARSDVGRFSALVKPYHEELRLLKKSSAYRAIFRDLMSIIYIHILSVYEDARDIPSEVDTPFMRALDEEVSRILFDPEGPGGPGVLAGVEYEHNDVLREIGWGPGLPTFLDEAWSDRRGFCMTEENGRRTIKARYHVSTLWHGCLAYLRCKDALLRWLTRTKLRLAEAAMQAALTHSQAAVAKKKDAEERAAHDAAAAARKRVRSA